MANQPRYDPLEASDFFADGMASRPRIAGTVARGDLSDDPFFDTGRINGQIGDGFPFPVTREVVDRGQERFNIYCSECHGRLGDGNGMIPSRGFRRPPSYHTDALRKQPTGHFFDVMTNGFGAMPKYGTMIPPRDRWTIVAYIRALQISQNATVEDVAPTDRWKIGAAEGGRPHTARQSRDQGAEHTPRAKQPLIRLRHLLPSRGEKGDQTQTLPKRSLVALLPAGSGEKVAGGRMRGRAIAEVVQIGMVAESSRPALKSPARSTNAGGSN